MKIRKVLQFITEIRKIDAEKENEDIRTPKITGKTQKRKRRKENNEEITQTPPTTLYRCLDIEEINDILTYNAFRTDLSFEDDSEGLRENPAGDDYEWNKCFTEKITKGALFEFMGPDHVIMIVDSRYLPKSKDCLLLPYVFDQSDSAGKIHEFEWRLFFKNTSIACDPRSFMRGIIICKESGDIAIEDLEELLLNLKYADIDIPVYYVKNAITQKGQKIFYELDENEEVVAKKSQ